MIRSRNRARGFSGGGGAPSFSDDDYSNLYYLNNYNTYTYEDIPVKTVTSTPFTRPANTTAYAFGDLVANSTTAGSVVAITLTDAARAVDTVSSILRVRLNKSNAVLTNSIFRVHFYNVLPTVTNGDNGAFLTPVAGWLGAADITCDQAFSDGASGVGVATTGTSIVFPPVTGTDDLYALIEARAGYTPTSGETFSVTVEVL